MLNKGAFALEIVRGDPELTADCRVTLNRGDRIGSLDCIWLLNCEDQNLVNCLACYVHENLDK